MTTYKFSCLVDDNPKYLKQMFIWVNSLIQMGKILPKDIYVQIINTVDAKFIDWLKFKQVNIVLVEIFDIRNVYLNKVVQADIFVDTDVDYIVFMDCDTVILDKFDPVDITNSSVYGKLTDWPTMPVKKMIEIFELAGLTTPKFVQLSLPKLNNNITAFAAWNYCNGGLYVLHQDLMLEFSIRWKYWARWCVDHNDLFVSNNYDLRVFVEQTVFALTMGDMNMQVTHLDQQWNYQIGNMTNVDVTPIMIHHHNCLKDNLMLEYSPHKNLNVGIDKYNTFTKSINTEFMQLFS